MKGLSIALELLQQNLLRSSDDGLLVAGVDEVGRGSLVGPVVAAAVILDPKNPVEGLADSKVLSANRRMELAAEIRVTASAWAIGRAEASEIDQINILQASLLAMKRAVAALTIQPGWVKVDGNRYPELDIPGEAIIKGDQQIAEISAASILAKVARDHEMGILDIFFPGYQFAQHKGYPTRQHLACLCRKGNTSLHRLSYRPVRDNASNYTLHK